MNKTVQTQEPQTRRIASPTSKTEGKGKAKPSVLSSTIEDQL
jgi:hypothetical protein